MKFCKDLRNFETCLSVNRNLCGKLVLSLKLQIRFYGKFKIAMVPFFIPDFDLISCGRQNFSFTLL